MFANGIESAPASPIGTTHRPPQLIAHRGNSAEFPENTLPALRSALELGIKHIAFDVQLTADCVPIVLRDHTLVRTANVDRCIFDLRATELVKLAVNEPARFGQRFADVGIPTLAQAVELLTSFPDAMAYVEIKTASLQHHGYETAFNSICDCLRSVGDRIALIASDLAAVEFIRRRKGYATGWALTEYNRLSALKCEAIAPDFAFCDRRLLPDNESRLWRGPWHWIIADVDSRSDALMLAARGAAFVQTTEVRKLLRELRDARNRN